MLGRFEKIYVVAALLFFCGALTPSDLAENQHSAAVNRFSSMLQLLVFPLLAVFIAVHWQSVRDAVIRARWLVTLCGFTLLSTVWSPIPGFTFRRSIILGATTLFAIYLGSCFEREEQINLFGWMLILEIVGSFAIVAILPTYGLSHGGHWGFWKGLFGHKNSLGRMAGFGVLLFGIARPPGFPSWVRIASLTGAAALLVLSGSATSLMCTVFVLCLYPALKLLRVNTRRTLPLWAAVAPLFFVVLFTVILNFSTLLDIAGRDATLTGRTPLWAAVIDVIAKRPLLGYGYSSFWRYHGLELDGILTTIHWNPPHAHDAYLDLCLDIGVLGLLVFLISAGLSLSRAIQCFRTERTAGANWPVVFLLFFLLYNLTESELLRSHSTLWLFYVTTHVSLLTSGMAEEVYEPDLVGEYA